MTATAYTVFHTNGLDKTSAVALAKLLGIRRDWARAKRTDIVAMIDAFPLEKRIEAALSMIPEYLTDDDMIALTDPESDFVDDDEETTSESANAEFTAKAEAPKAAPQTATQQSAASSNSVDVNSVAQSLAQLLASNKGTIDADDVRSIVAPMLTEQATTFEKYVTNVVKGIPPREILIKTEKTEVKMTGVQHREFETLLLMSAARLPDGNRMNTWLYGPAGTGKTTAARNVAKALDMEFYCNGSLTSETKLTGFIDAGGTYHRTPFREAWEHGGVYLFDEMDGSDPRVIVAFNSALANGIMAFPDGMKERHTDCIIIAATNTVHGANSQYTGRAKLDAATIDRFNFIEWDIDEAVERSICPNAEWVDYVQSFRRKVKAKGIAVQVTPRASLNGAALLAQGMKLEAVKRTTLRKGMTDEQWKLVEA